MATFPVKWYASNMQGAPSLGDTSAGALAALLKAVLVTGFGTLTVNSLVWDASENAAKATIAAGHAYKQDSVIEVGGAIPADYNGEHRVKKVSTTEVWFELDGGNPGIAAGGTLTMKVAPLGWTLTHESADGMVAIYRPTDISASGNVSFRIDNTAWTNWAGNTYLAKVQMVEDVVDINTFTLIADYRWPATQRYSSTKIWDLVGDAQLLYFLPGVGNWNYQTFYCLGYIKSIRPGDRYHAVLVSNPSMNGTDVSNSWNNRDGLSPNNWGTPLSSFNDSGQRWIARPYHQLFGLTTWWTKGVFTRFGTGLSVPNGPDNGFYLSTDPIMVLENNSHLRGYLPGLVVPFADITSWDRKNFANLPALPGKLVRFIRPTYQANVFSMDPRSLVGFDLTGPWR